MAKAKILIVDDEDSPRESLRYILKDRYEVVTCEDGPVALTALREQGPFDVMLLDMKMPGMTGLEVLEKALQVAPGLPVVMATAITDAKPAVEAMKLGAVDYLNKPFDVSEIRLVVERILDRQSVASSAPTPAAAVSEFPNYENIVGQGDAMQRVYHLIQRLKDNDSTVLVLGETGTGKELVARALHYSSIRKSGPFIAVHCAAIPSELLESELFGHEKGSFTGALQRRIGMFEAASGGTLFLDEIGEMPLGTQTKLLRAIQEREIRRVGSQATIKINVRLVCATNRDLEEEVRKGAFREDLFYRVNVVPIQLPSLTQRREDIPLLVGHFTKRFASELGRELPAYTDEAMQLLVNYSWPGNVRELEHVIERIMVMTDGNEIHPQNLPFVVANASEDLPEVTTRLAVSVPRADLGPKLRFEEGRLDLPKLTEDIERRAITEALERTGGVMTEAARALNITRRMLRYKMDKLGIATARGSVDEAPGDADPEDMVEEPSEPIEAGSRSSNLDDQN